MWIIGDVHGQFRTWRWIIEQMPLKHELDASTHGYLLDEMPASVAAQVLETRETTGFKGLDSSLQLGDFGIFYEEQIHSGKIDGMDWPDPAKHKFFRGNHDNPNLIKDLPGYLGDWGYSDAQGMFWLGGAWSIDKIYRVPGETWWEDEELSMEELTNALALYEDIKPRIMITHEVPTTAKDLFLDQNRMHNINHSSRTEKCLQFMFEAHQPELWVFGHYHRRWSAAIAGSGGLTQFECLGEMIHGKPKDCIFEIPGITW